MSAAEKRRAISADTRSADNNISNNNNNKRSIILKPKEHKKPEAKVKKRNQQAQSNNAQNSTKQKPTNKTVFLHAKSCDLTLDPPSNSSALQPQHSNSTTSKAVNKNVSNTNKNKNNAPKVKPNDAKLSNNKKLDRPKSNCVAASTKYEATNPSCDNVLASFKSGDEMLAFVKNFPDFSTPPPSMRIAKAATKTNVPPPG